MTSIASVKANDLRSRRQQLKRRRQVRFLQAVWRLLLIGSMTGAVVWVVKLPGWVIQQPEQVKIQGNDWLSEKTLHQLLPIEYPKPILEIEPQHLGDQLEARLREQLDATASVVEVDVTRNLLPPSLTVKVAEHHPVAIVLPPQDNPEKTGEMGLIDAQGVWMSKEGYTRLEMTPQLPDLIVIGFSEGFAANWPPLYEAVAESTVKIFDIDLRSPDNLILQTQLGEVHFGPYEDQRFREQLRVLAQMRGLPTHVQTSQINYSQIDYIDLTNPSSPAIQLR
ncbi:FtsQ-type POTRA domain-containing protein [Spirulina sp. CS-785/01]|uniref:cell division protein FtsQ/DivIB n=1 Tax=Spirulina sp. CS-785/01 TaxID=3021716 RepID=UPI00232D6177|nr:FtsQ-type POTRA domain-containing protein [Spirulina sp. CS-785/01]MDB9313671.1 FtsQ-type POTRA domain-containing protein [Spirulina sp. CS-785/01]